MLTRAGGDLLFWKDNLIHVTPFVFFTSQFIPSSAFQHHYLQFVDPICYFPIDEMAWYGLFMMAVQLIRVRKRLVAPHALEFR